MIETRHTGILYLFFSRVRILTFKFFIGKFIIDNTQEHMCNIYLHKYPRKINETRRKSDPSQIALILLNYPMTMIMTDYFMTTENKDEDEFEDDFTAQYVLSLKRRRGRREDGGG